MAIVRPAPFSRINWIPIVAVLVSVRSGNAVQRSSIGIAAAANKATAVLMGTVLAVYVGHRGSPFAVGLVATFFWLGIMLFSPVWGAIADATGKRRAVLLGTGVMAAVTALPLAVIDGVWGPIGLRGLFAVFAAGFMPVMLAIVSFRGGTGSRGRELGFFNTARAVGLAVGQLSAGVLLGLLTPTGVFLVVAGIAGFVVLAVLLTHDPTPAQEHHPNVMELLKDIRYRAVPTIGSEKLAINGLRWLYVASFLRNTTVLGIGSLLPVYLVSTLGVSEFVMGILLAINPTVQVILMYAIGRISDVTGRKMLIVAGLFASGLHGIVIAGAVLSESTTVAALIVGVGLFVLAVGWSGLLTGSVAFIGDVADSEHESELQGLRESARGFGGVVGPILFGAVATYLGYAATFTVGSLLAFLGVILVFVRVSESHPERSGVASVGSSNDV